MRVRVNIEVSHQNNVEIPKKNPFSKVVDIVKKILNDLRSFFAEANKPTKPFKAQGMIIIPRSSYEREEINFNDCCC